MHLRDNERYYRTLIRNHTQSFNDLNWLDWDFKVAIFFDIKYLRNDTR